MRLQEKSLSKLTLLDLLRRKRKNLETYLNEAGIVTYDRLVRSCTSIGVVPPSEEQFLEARGNPVTPDISSPTDGILVLNPPEEIDLAASSIAESAEPTASEELVTDQPKPSKKKKKQQESDPDQQA